MFLNVKKAPEYDQTGAIYVCKNFAQKSYTPINLYLQLHIEAKLLPSSMEMC